MNIKQNQDNKRFDYQKELGNIWQQYSMIHLAGCAIRKKLVSRRYTIDTSVKPEKFTDGYALGVAFRHA
jgi:hypothetical protein